MVSALVYFDTEEDEILKKYCDMWHLNKNDAIKKIIKLFDEEEKLKEEEE